MEELYPLKFQPIFKDKIWGGRQLQQILGKALPADEPIGESWEISDHGDDTSIVSNGIHQGKNLHEIMKSLDHTLLGSDVKQQSKLGVFPLLIKFIAANDRLSIQVHPNDEYAAKHEGKGELGKTEAWHILHAEPNAKLIVGVKKDVTPQQFQQGLENNTLEQFVQEITVSTGDTIFIPSGRLHAIMEGIVLCEVQQNSDTTYRVYDWGRVGLDGKPRDLHIKQSLDVIDFEFIAQPKINPLSITKGPNTLEYLVTCPYFSIEKLKLKETFETECDGRHFICMSIIEGNARIKNANTSTAVSKGESVLLPAALGKFEIVPDATCTILQSYVPDIEKDIVTPLKAQGVGEDEIKRIVFT